MSELPIPERRPVYGARLDDIDLDLVRRHIRTAIEKRGFDGPTEPIEYLTRYHCLAREGDELVPTVVGILTFTPEPDRWLDTAGIDIAQFSGAQTHSTALLFSRQVRGPIVEMITRALDLLWTRSEHRYHLRGSERIEEHAYNQTVIRELTVNALCHRSWDLAGSMARIEMHPDCMRWITPGGLPAGVTVENIRVAQVSRNPALAQILYHAGLVEKFGMGIDTVLDILSTWGCDPPTYRDDTNFFTFQVWARPLDSLTRQPDILELTPRQERILEEIGRRRVSSSTEIADSIGEARRNIQRDLQALVKAGLLHVDGPTSRSRYRLVHK
jgi:predicted HTH transcriptional regulator